jgi:lysophospholipase L1-like esterase
MTEQKSILCYGDSLTWGWIPVTEGAPTLRYPYRDRWTGAMAAHLGEEYHVVEEGLSARTTSLDDPNDPRLNGSAYLPSALASHLPLDLVIVMLGTNDTKSYFRRTPFENLLIGRRGRGCLYCTENLGRGPTTSGSHAAPIL